MDDKADILISLKPRHVESILTGSKTVELRRRRLHVEPGTIVWMYATAPVSALLGCARVESIVSASPSAIWSKFKSQAGISKVEFDDYFFGSETAHALLLTDIRVMTHPLQLVRMRQLVKGFHPPQFFCRLNGAATKMRLQSRKCSRLKKFSA
jgi:predicted transcriptional regulator